MVVPAKGSHPDVITRLASFIREIGLLHFCYRSDREPAICSMIEDTCAKAGRTAHKVTRDDRVSLKPVPLESGNIPSIDHAQDDAVPEIEHAHVGVPEHTHP